MKTEQPGDTPRFPNHVPLVIIVSGPAGVGKTSLVKSLVATSQQFIRAITSTCRPARRDEIEGVDYHFLTAEEFERQLKAGDFIEHAQVYGNSYGMPKQNISDALSQEKDLVINIDVQGAFTIRQQARSLKLQGLGYAAAGNATLSEILVSVFLMPVSIDQLKNRLKKRGTDDETTIPKRLTVAREEIKRWPEYDYVIVTGSCAEDLDQLLSIIRAERVRTTRLRALV